jgi:hypothetical protein
VEGQFVDGLSRFEIPNDDVSLFKLKKGKKGMVSLA